MTTTATVASRLAAVRARVAAACECAGRDPASVTIVGITKTHPVEAVDEALAAGLEDLGENRAQELIPKAEAAAAMGLAPRWHFVGHLQRNKVRQVLPLIAVLHSLDSVRLAAEIDRRAEHGPDAQRAGRPLPCYLEVNVGGEASKEGVEPSQLGELLRGVAALPRIEVAGLMTVAPPVDDAELVRPVFRELRELAAAHGLEGLSMGMTDDYEVAIEEGATLVRLGRVIFGPRRA
jgi:pyridoxal phosphate enzyme (YggS family)